MTLNTDPELGGKSQLAFPAICFANAVARV